MALFIALAAALILHNKIVRNRDSEI